MLSTVVDFSKKIALVATIRIKSTNEYIKIELYFITKEQQRIISISLLLFFCLPLVLIVNPRIYILLPLFTTLLVQRTRCLPITVPCDYFCMA